MSKVSVVVPSYNQASFISACLDSILRQTKKDYEIIVVDDASSDNTSEVIKSYLTKIKYIRNSKNLGLYSLTCNIGIKQATGDYILIVAADDWLAPTILEEEAVILDQNPGIGLVYSQSTRIEGNKPLLIIHKIAGKQNYIGRDDFENLLTTGDFISSINVLARKKIYNKVGLFDTHLKYMADYEMWIRIAKDYPLAYIAKPLSFYRIHGNNMHLNSDFENKTRVEFKYILKKYFSKNLDKRMVKIKKNTYHAYNRKTAINKIVEGNLKTAFIYWWRAYKEKPLSILTWQAIQPYYFFMKKSLKKHNA